MINLKYSLVIEATEDPSFFTFYSPDLEGFTGVGHSIEDCLYKARWGTEEYVTLLKERGLPVAKANPNPTIVIQNEKHLTASPAKYARIAQAMGENIDSLTNDEAAGLLVEHLFRLLETVGIPSTLGEYGITEKALDKLVAGGMEFSRLFIPNPRNLTEADVREIYTNALE